MVLWWNILNNDEQYGVWVGYWMWDMGWVEKNLFWSPSDWGVVLANAFSPWITSQAAKKHGVFLQIFCGLSKMDDGDNCNTTAVQQDTWWFYDGYLYYLVLFSIVVYDKPIVVLFSIVVYDKPIVVLFSVVVYDKPWMMNDAWLNTWGRVETMTYFGNESILVPSLIGSQAILCFSWAWIAHIRVPRPQFNVCWTLVLLQLLP